MLSGMRITGRQELSHLEATCVCLITEFLAVCILQCIMFYRPGIAGFLL